MYLDAVFKVGGSLGRGAGLEALCKEISRLGRSYRLLVVPGGGEFADQVRKACRRYSLSGTAAHFMALLAMDQYGYLLNQLIAGSSLITDIVSARQTEKSGRTAILLPSATVIRDDSLPHSWQVTSDTIAAWVAHRARCRRLVLLKNVDGLMIAEDGQYSTAGLIAKLTVEQLAEHSGGVDEYLCRFLASANLEVWVINGLRPKRLAELLDANCTIGTRIIPAAGKNPPAALA